MFPKLENLHHATIITGNREKNLELVKNYLIDQEITIQGNPDVLVYKGEQLLMETAQEIISSISAKKVSSHRFCIISYARMATDVQNRLLKTLEEPQEGTYFLVLIPQLENILPTIISRCQVIVGDQSIGETRFDVIDFLGATLPERFAQIEGWVKNKKDEDNLSKSEVEYFLDQLEKELWDKKIKDEELFKDIRAMREYVSIRGASHRVILDYIAIISPKVK